MKGIIAFTLLELLVLVALIVTVAALAVTAVHRAKEKANQITCLNRLKVCGMAVLMYSQDNQGVVNLYTESPEIVWWESLEKGGYLRSGDVLVCPSFPPNHFVNRYATFGIRVNPDATPADCLIISKGSQWFRLRKIRHPEHYFFLADSAFRGPPFPPPDWQNSGFGFRVSRGLMHLRHRGSVNCSFADGHIEPLNRDQIVRSVVVEMPVSTIIEVADGNGRVIQINP